MIKTDEYSEYLDFALTLAKECGALAREYHSSDLSFEPKGDNSPVTKADVAINRLAIERCQAAYPAIGILGEEESAAGSSEDLLWVCDPIDGTTPYVLGMSASTFCLALVKDGQPVVGVVYDFMNDRLYYAIKGQGAYLNGERIVQPNYQPMKLINLEWWFIQAVPLQGTHERFFEKGYQVMNYATCSFMSMQVATGRIAATVYDGIYSWDVAAAKVIVEECGGIVKSIVGEDQRYDGEIKGMIIAHADYYDEVFEVIKASRI